MSDLNDFDFDRKSALGRFTKKSVLPDMRQSNLVDLDMDLDGSDGEDMKLLEEIK